MPLLELENVNKRFINQGRSELVLRDISLTIKKGELVTILGQSGCGKSTLLNTIGGFENPTEGRVLLEGNVISKPGRHCIMLFQDYGLLPWRSVLKNVELGLEPENLNAKEKRARAMEYLKLVDLEKNIGQFPHQLSGGMKQRVAIARALAMKPELILMDEPFAALDAFNRYNLQDELLQLQEKAGITIVLVTHDIDEAVYLSDRIIIMESNTGSIGKDLTIDTAKPRDRSHSDFQHFRKVIFTEFNIDSPHQPIEYTI